MSLFITLEGLDGSGKSTQAELLADALRRNSDDVTVTREPGGTDIGEAIRHIVLDPDAPSITPLAMALLISASRAQLVETVIRPALEAGSSVIADRYADSTLAYQGYGLGLDFSVVRDLAAIATEGLKPDVSIFVDIDPEVGLARCVARGARSRIDREAIEFHYRVRAGYLELISRDSHRWIAVDGSGPASSIHDAILRQLQPLLKSERTRV